MEEHNYGTIDDLSRLSLKVGKVLSAEPVEGSEKLLKVMVDLAEEEPRQILAGLAKTYPGDELVGQLVLVTTNLAPRPMMGTVSNGMILCSNGTDGPVLLAPIKPVEPGSTVQ